jgi:hypothetical protein
VCVIQLHNSFIHATFDFEADFDPSKKIAYSTGELRHKPWMMAILEMIVFVCFLFLQHAVTLFSVIVHTLPYIILRSP